METHLPPPELQHPAGCHAPSCVRRAGAFAQEKRDIFKTEIFLTPYSKLGDADIAEDYPRLNGQLLFMTGYTGYFGIKDSNGQIPRSHWNSVQPTVEAAFVWQFSRQFAVLSKVTFDSSVEATEDNAFPISASI